MLELLKKSKEQINKSFRNEQNLFFLNEHPIELFYFLKVSLLANSNSFQ